MPSHTLLLIPNEFGTVFERLERLGELEIQYSRPDFLMLYLHHRKIQRQRTHLRNYKIVRACQGSCYISNLIPIGRVPIITLKHSTK